MPKLRNDESDFSPVVLRIRVISLRRSTNAPQNYREKEIARICERSYRILPDVVSVGTGTLHYLRNGTALRNTFVEDFN